MKNLWAMLNVGFVGPYKDYLLGFMSLQQDPKKKKSFEEIFPDINDFMRLKDHRNVTQDEMALQAARAMLSMGDSSGAPEWLKRAASGG